MSGGHEQNQRWSDRSAPALNSQRISGIAEYRLSGDGRIRAEAGLARSNPYNSFLSSVSTGDTHLSQTYGLVSYEQSGLLVRGWWNGVFSETQSLTHPLLVPLLGVTDRFGQTKQDYSLNSYDLETRYQFKPSETLHLNIGANYRYITGLSNMFGNQTADNRLGLYTQGDWRVWPSLELSAGLRYDLDTFIAPTLSPRGAIVYHPTSNHAVRLSDSLAYRPPTAFEVGLNALSPVTIPGLPPLATTILGSSNVNLEQIASYEVGYQGWWWEHRLRTRATGFFNHISDLTAFRNPTSNPLNPVRPMNGGVADIYGGEIGAEFLVTSWLSGFANYAYQEVGQSSTGFSRRGFPHHKVNAGLRM